MSTAEGAGPTGPPGARPAPARRLPLRRLAIVVGAWFALVGCALLIAHSLDSPSGESSPDEAQAAAVGPVATTGTTATPATPAKAGNAAQLPPFAMVLDHPLPRGVANLVPARQAEILRTRAMATGNPTRLVELGSVMQLLGDGPSARFAYRSALQRDPGNVAAQVGLAVVPGATQAGLATAATRLRALATTHPDDQLVSFNQAWVALYRRRGLEARTALERTEALGPGTRLGRTAAALLAALAKVQLGG